MQRVFNEGFADTYVKYIVALALTYVPAACSRSSSSAGSEERPARADRVQVTTDRTSYRAGDPVTLTIHNGSSDTVTFNPCTRTLEREQEGRWSAVAEPQRICTMEAWILAPGEQRAGPTELPADLTAGSYRAVVALTLESASPESAGLEARSGAFAVER
jgi:hypothetical protein